MVRVLLDMRQGVVASCRCFFFSLLLRSIRPVTEPRAAGAGRAASVVAMSTAAIAQVEQNQRAYQKQDNIFVCKKRVVGTKAS